MFKIFVLVLDFHTKSIANWIVKRLVEEQNTEEKIQVDIFQGDWLSLQLFVNAMMSLNYIKQKCKTGQRFTKSQEMINYKIYKDDINILPWMKKNQNPFDKQQKSHQNEWDLKLQNAP